jgi:ADP-ribose pyrophosphatase
VIASRTVVLSTPFFRVVGKQLHGQSSSHPYYALETQDYVTVIAKTNDGSFILVRQFRPAVESMTLEFPAGHVEPGQEPADAARAELSEETGYSARDVRLVGRLMPDSGRMANRMWVYVAIGVEPMAQWTPEPDVGVVLVTPHELRQRLTDGTFDHALHIAAWMVATQSGTI